MADLTIGTPQNPDSPLQSPDAFSASEASGEWAAVVTDQKAERNGAWPSQTATRTAGRTASGNGAQPGQSTRSAAGQQPTTPNGAQGGHPDGQEEHGSLFYRGFGILQAGIGAVEFVGGAAFAVGSAETVVGAVAGGAVAAHGIDDIQAGCRQFWSGKPTTTVTQQAATNAATLAGATPTQAMLVGTIVDMAAGGVGGAEKAGVKLAEGMVEAGAGIVKAEEASAAGKSWEAAAKGAEAVSVRRADRGLVSSEERAALAAEDVTPKLRQDESLIGGASSRRPAGRAYESQWETVRQPEGSDWCGAACGQMAAERLGVKIRQAEIAAHPEFKAPSRVAHVNLPGGFNAPGLTQALNDLAPVPGRIWIGGMISQDVSTSAKLLEQLRGYLNKTDASIILQVEGGKHFIIVDEITARGGIVIRDPRFDGARLITAQQLFGMHPVGQAVFSFLRK